jgi:hypothetical protein
VLAAADELLAAVLLAASVEADVPATDEAEEGVLTWLEDIEVASTLDRELELASTLDAELAKTLEVLARMDEELSKIDDRLDELPNTDENDALVPKTDETEVASIVDELSIIDDFEETLMELLLPKTDEDEFR